MRSIESEGATIDQAIARALVALGAERDQVQIEILESGARGILGIGRRKARVRATMRAPLHTWLGVEDAPAAPVPAPQGTAGEREEGSDTIRRAGPADSLDGVAILGHLLGLMGLEATAVELGAGPRGERIVEIQGPRSSETIGRQGEVLDAMEYLLNRMMERSGLNDRFLLDAAGYRAQRRTSLEDLARRLAEQARRRRRPVTVNALSPTDRRIVHLALQAERGVAVRSVGQGFYRKLTIIPEGVRGGGRRTRG